MARGECSPGESQVAAREKGTRPPEKNLWADDACGVTGERLVRTHRRGLGRDSYDGAGALSGPAPAESRRRPGAPARVIGSDDQQWPVGWERATWAQSWAGYRQSLAASMGDKRFGPLATAFGFIEQFQNSLAADRRPFQPADAVFLRDVRQAVEEARTHMPIGHPQMGGALRDNS